MTGTYLTVPGLLKPGEIEYIRQLLEGAVYEDGVATAGEAARAAKKNLQLPRQGSQEQQQIGGMVLHAISNSPLIQAAIMPRRVLLPIISRYEPGMQYGHHVDSPLMSDDGGTIRTDVGMTLFLSPPDSYAGGELEVFTPSGLQRFKLNSGDAIIYPTTAVHGVLPVTSGVRLAAVSWMQCAVRSAEHRELLFNLKSAATLVEQRIGQGPENLALLQVYSNLVRMWAEL